MTLKIPEYIQELNIANLPLEYKWDDPNECRLHENSRHQNNFDALHNNVIYAYSVSISEWIFWRLNHLVQLPIALQFIEASWAAVVDRRYLTNLSDTANVRGPHVKAIKAAGQFLCVEKMVEWERVKNKLEGPLLQTILLLGEAADSTDHNYSAIMEADFLSNLAIQLLDNKTVKAFKKWRRDVYDRILSKHFGFYNATLEEESHFGSPVPREIFDLNFDFRPDMTNELLAKFLGQLDYTQNPFLASPELMKELGFEGKPYTMN